MEYIRYMLKDSRFHTLMAISFLSILLWDFGPLLSLGGKHPFANPNNRFIGMLGLALLWGVTNLRPELNPFRSQEFTEVHNQIKMIRNKLRNTLQAVKDGQKKRFGTSPKIFTHLVIGPRHA
ncbi:MAG: hypothetical protein M3R00_09165, partial [Pseudomonadota bacterium]|nr:hypothetical protein [Pseudomonadota bacterium]